MKKHLLLISILILIHCQLYTVKAQPTIQWQKSLGGTASDNANSIHQTRDGGYIVSGGSASNNGDVSGNHGGFDIWVVKLNTDGSIQWQKSLGGTESDVANSIQQTADGGYIVAGESDSNNGDVSGNHGSSDFWVVKLDTSGNIQWQKSLGGTGTDVAKSIHQTADGGYIVAGRSASNNGDVSGNHGSYDFWVVKLGTGGNIQWQKSLGGTAWEDAYCIQKTTDGGYIVTGESGSNNGDVSGHHGAEDYWVVKLDSDGNIQWQKSLGGTLSDVATSIQQTADGGYIVNGISSSNDGDVSGNHGNQNIYDYWVVKLNTGGNIQWQKSLGGTGYDLTFSIQQTADGGYIVSGLVGSNDGDVSSNHGKYDYWIVKLDSDGSIQWQKCMGGTEDDVANSIQQTADGGYIVAGESDSNNGDVSGNHGSSDFWVMKLEVPTDVEKRLSEQTLRLYPNPVRAELIIENGHLRIEDVHICNVLGEKILQPAIQQTEKLAIDVSTLQSGIYFIRAALSNGSVLTERFVKE